MSQDETLVATALAYEQLEKTFRLIMRRASLLALLVALAQSFLFWFFGDPMWQWTLMMAAGYLVCFAVITQARNYMVLVIGTVGQFTLMVIYASVLTSTYGRDFAFHFMLFSMVPIIMVGVRTGTLSKCIISAALLFFMLWLDTNYPSSKNPLLEYHGAVEMMRAMNIAMIFLVAGSLVHYYYQASWEARKRLLLTANFDSLTRLINRRRLNEVATLSIAQSQRHHRPLSVVLCDIDHFKSINDRFGHRAGDEVLVGVAKVLMECARATDSVSRWGGEEFLIVLTETDLQGAQVIAERIRSRIAAEPMRSEKTSIKIAMTLGVAQFTESESFSNLVARADAALYQGKANGRNQVVLAKPPPGLDDGQSSDRFEQSSKHQNQGDIAP